jgi:beta-lactamase regulating signal transducer with metallopeptidase domain
MKTKIETLKHRWLMITLAGLIGLAAASTTGEAASSNVSTVTTQTTSGAPGNTSTSSVTTQREVVTETHHGGLIGGLVYTIGEVVTIPFKIIGSLF